MAEVISINSDVVPVLSSFPTQQQTSCRKESNSSNRFKVGSLYSGIGGIDLGFIQAGFEVVWANEWDKMACVTYRKNFNHQLLEGDVWKIDETELEPIDVLCAGFPCQAFSVAGYRKGFSDERGQHFFRVLDFVYYHKPQVIFLENVKNLNGHDNGKTWQTMSDELERSGYVVHAKIINSTEVGIPQNRERMYIVCFRKETVNKMEVEWYKFPIKNDKVVQIEDLLEEEVNENLIYGSDWKYYETLKKEIKKENTIYQWRRRYVRENKSNVCPTLTANMGTGGNNVPLLKQGEIIRKLAPRECFRFQGFPDSFALPDIAPSHLYKQAGNSVTVPVIKVLADSIQKVLSN